MSPSLPVITSDQRKLAQVLDSAFSAVRGEANALGLRAVNRAVVLLVDGLGSSNLASRVAHARTIRDLPARTIASGFPTTTASALSSLMTGADPGTTGMVGYSIRDPATGLLVNQLTGLDAVDVTRWQPIPTLWERNSDLATSIVASPRYRDSGLTRAILRGAPYVPVRNDEERIAAVSEFFRLNRRGLVYVYVPELDMTAHASGVVSDSWIRRLEELDALVSGLLRLLGARDGLLITADHGVLDVPPSRHIVLDDALLGGTVIGGEPRFLHVYTDGDTERSLRVWREAEGHRAHIVTRSEAIAAGWFGAVSEAMRERIGDILVTPQSDHVYYDPRTATPQSMAMVGQHGGLSKTETHVPLIRGGAFG